MTADRDRAKGIYFNDKETPHDVRMATDYFRKAIEKDHDYAAAYAGLAHCYIFLSAVNEMPTAERFVRAKEAAEKAVALDDKLDDAHVEMACIAIGGPVGLEKSRKRVPAYSRAQPEFCPCHRLESALQLLNEKVDSPHKLSLSVAVARFDPQNPVSLGELLSLANREMFERKRVRVSCARISRVQDKGDRSS